MIRLEFTMRLRFGREPSGPEPHEIFESQGAMVENAARPEIDGMEARVGFTRENY